MARDLGGWLGYGVSHVLHTVVPRVRASGVATSKRARDTEGWTQALDFELLPLREARAEQGMDPLSLLTKRDLATLLRFCEAVLCPGWAPKDKAATPAGFLAARRGRRAATDRLAMLLLALEAREDGRVRMAPGRLPKGYSRAEVTVARLLGCSLEMAVEVLKRLLAMGAVDWARPERHGQDRLLVPAIRAAYERIRGASSSEADASREVPGSEEKRPPSSEGEPCARCAGDDVAEDLVLEGDGWAQLSFEDVPVGAADSACGDQTSVSDASSQVDTGLVGDSVPGRCAGPHASHPPVVSLSESSAAELDDFSGSAVLGEGRLREHASAGEDRPEPALPGMASSGTNDPLRGEQPNPSPAVGAGAWRTGVFARPVAVPEDLKRVLAPVAWLWAGLGRESTGRWLAKAVRLELVRLRSFVGDQDEVAERRLAERLKRRLDRQGTRPVQDLAGWLIKRGLPQNTECWSNLCDDGIRIDTAGPCESCDCMISDRRGLRTVVATRVAAQHRNLPAGEWRAVYEGELQAAVQYQAAADLARRERTAQEHVGFLAAVEEQRARIAAAKAEQAARPCADCGVPEAAGLCMTCSLQRETGVLVAKAVDIAVALRADVDDLQALATLTEQVSQDTWAFVQRAEVPEGGGGATSRAFAQRNLAKRVLEQRRRRALDRLRESEPAEAEAAHVKRRALCGMFLTEKNIKRAVEAADRARNRVAEKLLGEFLGDLYRARAAAVPREALPPWRKRCAELAGRPLSEDAATAGELATSSARPSSPQGVR
ncbi:hypothetical protein ACIBQ5_37605 [Streptomyces massasporeus]|uniref:hypothetical protein n=1 Tax=Streptomyces massasporeus TaxID=67324 RepID=UPI0037BDE95F